MAELKLTAELREGLGKNKVDKIRAQKSIPAVIYSRGEETRTVQVSEREFERVFREAGTSTLIDLVCDGVTTPVLIKEVQAHPYKPFYYHIDFQGIKMDEKIRVTVPVVLLGRDEIRLQPSVLMHMLNEIEIECLPAYIPQTAEVEVADMQYDDVLFVSDLDVAKDDNITILTPLEEPVCSLVEPKEVEEEEEDLEEAVSAADVPTVGEDEAEGEEEEA